LPLDRVRIATYLSAVIPLLFTGQGDAIGLLGLAVSCCYEDSALEPVRELIVAAEAAWAEIMEIESPDERRAASRRIFRVVGLAQAMALYE
jgi:hypothetical protein